MFVGRKHELELIHACLDDRSKAQLIIVYGRRRVGKSTLIKESLKKEKKILYFEGIEGVETKVQIKQFLQDLAGQTGQVKLAATNWSDVFRGLGQTIENGRWVVVIDEFPWLACGRTQIVSALKLYWDCWVKNTNLVLFLCGSIASFMVKHLVHSKALHNRKTLEICLSPLSPQETAQFIPKRSRFEKAQLYMTFGGIPKYLEQINSNISLHKNINRLCFTAGGFFIDEFETLFKEQFRAVKTYESIVRLLANGPANVSEISRYTKIAKGGGLITYLKHLAQAQFIREYAPSLPSGKHKKRTVIYKLVDPFLLFYFRYIQPHKSLITRNCDEDLFRALTVGNISQYYGFAFERFCEDSYALILKKLKLSLSDVISMGPYFQQRGQKGVGVQIDQLIMRRDNVWTVLECKYSPKPVQKNVIQEVQRKIDCLQHPNHITVEPVLVAAGGANPAVKNAGCFSTILDLDDLLP